MILPYKLVDFKIDKVLITRTSVCRRTIILSSFGQPIMPHPSNFATFIAGSEQAIIAGVAEKAKTLLFQVLWNALPHQ